MTRPSAMRPTIALTAALILGACASPPTRFFTLDAAPGAAAAPATAYAGPALRVRAVHIPDALDRAELASEPHAGIIAVNDFAHWAAPLGRLARAALSEDLAARLSAGAVATPEAPLPAGGCDLTVDILSFNVVEGQARMQVSWALIPGAGGHAAPPVILALDGPAPGTRAEAVAAGLSGLLGALSATMAESLTRTPSDVLAETCAPPPPPPPPASHAKAA